MPCVIAASSSVPKLADIVAGHNGRRKPASASETCDEGEQEGEAPEKALDHLRPSDYIAARAGSRPPASVSQRAKPR